MEEKSMTAFVSCFSRCYHSKNSEYKIFNDTIAEKLLSEEEYNTVSKHMTDGINFFNPSFKGTNEEALRWIVDNQLSPSVLGRSAFCEKALFNAIKIGCRQYLIYASGYDTFAYRNKFNDLEIFEIDRSEMIKDKIRRVQSNELDSSRVHYITCEFTDNNWINSILKSSYNKENVSFSSLLGISYYLSNEEFAKMIRDISKIIINGSSIVFDYPNNEDSQEVLMTEKLASAADEKMKSRYSYKEIERILSKNGFLIYEHLDYHEMTNHYFYDYNTLNPNHKIIAPKGICYCLAVKNQL